MFQYYILLDAYSSIVGDPHTTHALNVAITIVALSDISILIPLDSETIFPPFEALASGRVLQDMYINKRLYASSSKSKRG